MEHKKKQEQVYKLPVLLEIMLGFVIISLCDAAGSLLSKWLQLPIPGPIFGMLFLLILLLTGLVKLTTVAPAAQILIGLMLLFLLPGGVGLMTIFDKFEGIIPQLLLISSLTCALVIISSGYVTQMMVRLLDKRKYKLSRTGERREND